MFYFCCFTTIIIVATITSIPPLLLILCWKQVLSGAVEFTNQLSKPVRSIGSPCVESINWVILTREDYLDPLHLWVIKNCFLAPFPGSIALFKGLLELSCLL